MKIYYYINTGHRVGLDRLRRSAPIINTLEEMGVEITMLTNDFRAGEYAKEQFGIKKYVSVDIVRNIANIATTSDVLIFDSQEESRVMWEDMASYFHKFIRISDNPDDFASKNEVLLSSMKEIGDAPQVNVVDPRYFDENEEHNGGIVYFWGDDDYEQKLLELSDAFEGLDITLLEGYYFFMQYGSELSKKFKSVEESEYYDEILKKADTFITSSPQSALEALAAGSNPIYLKKPGVSNTWDNMMKTYNIPVVSEFNNKLIKEKISEKLINKNEFLKKETLYKVSSYIKDNIR
ncbi:hypothetical protein RZR97_11560 [Hydrogenimonas thermophila]|uniref:hypothetical protein n=1 Tax=Hydrogenimonas thermophila TaxID=223786 RepID=UPI002936ECF1|nr:hypothetical protein [Hydrogenimonas thermophila]WOE69733.1 hypothetical protein RZR91_11570 [Hydrogenimonas thermophila]WOE72247.1 hypothetical protein RZR97_11560 [Hydrogenimonas thermophila]